MKRAFLLFCMPGCTSWVDQVFPKMEMTEWDTGSIDTGIVDVDADDDGYTQGDGDCDDENPDTYPGAPEVQDLEDNDCDGLKDEDFVAPGDVFITEFMANPYQVADDYGEWIEIQNRSGFALELGGWTLASETESVILPAPARVEPGDWLVLAASGDFGTNGGLVADVVYTRNLLMLANDDDEIRLELEGEIIFAINYTNDKLEWPIHSGVSASLDPDVDHLLQAVKPASWCKSSSEYGDGDFGTPGTVNDDCPD